MATLAEFRQNFPMYSAVADDDLADALHRKYYPNLDLTVVRQRLGMAPTRERETPFTRETETGAVKEIGKQALGLGELAARAVTPTPLPERLGQFTPEKVALAKRSWHDVGQALTHPLDTARGTLADWMEQAFAEPRTAQQAEARGAALVRGAEAVAPAGGMVREAASLAARPIERALAPAAERIAARGEAETARRVAQVEDKNELIGRVRGLGLRLTPQQAGGGTARTVASLAGRPQLEREISQYNAPRVLRAAGRDVGLGVVNEGTVARAIGEATAAYKQPRGLGRVNLRADLKFQADMQAALDETLQERSDFPDITNPRVEREVAAHLRPSADADSMVTRVQKLREAMKSNFRGSAEDVQLARVQSRIAKAYEDAIERHGTAAGKQAVVAQFRRARERLAKLHAIDNALTAEGLDLAKLAREPYLTGNLRTLADAYTQFKPSFQTPGNIREHRIGALDLVLGATRAAAASGAGYAAGGMHGALAGGLALAARPATRAVLRSRPFQAAAIGPRVPAAGFVTREARKIAQAGARTQVPQTLASVAPPASAGKRRGKPKIRPKTQPPARGS